MYLYSLQIKGDSTKNKKTKKIEKALTIVDISTHGPCTLWIWVPDIHISMQQCLKEYNQTNK
jgi:hypothetical protein